MHDPRRGGGGVRFADFRIWQDANGNGESDEGEVLTLEEAGIASVDLVPRKVDYESGGNRILGFSAFHKADGSSGLAGDVAFGFEGESAAVSEDNDYLRVDQRGSLIYAVGTGGALNLELAANALAGALGSAAADSLMAGNREDGILLDGNGGNDTILFDAADTALDGGDGFDTALVSGTAGVSLDLGAAHLESAVGGDGADTVYDTGGFDTIEFGHGIELSDLDAESSGSNFILGLRDWATDGGAVAGRVRIRRTLHRRATVSRLNTATHPCAVNRSAFKHALRTQGIGRSGVCLW